MARGSNQREGRVARSESLGRPLPIGRFEDTQGLRNLFPAARIPKTEKSAAKIETTNSIMSKTDEYAGQAYRGFLDTQKIEEEQNKYAKTLSAGMVDGDGFNGLEDYFPKGMSTQFINALAKNNIAPGPNDPDTINAIARIIDARVLDNLEKQDFQGQFSVRSVQDPDGFRLELYTSEYRGRGEDGEKQYRSSGTKEIAFIPHDEISGRITRTSVANSPDEMLKSKAFLKAKALDGYLDALLMTSDF
jgi:hypothetical protein